MAKNLDMMNRNNVGGAKGNEDELAKLLQSLRGDKGDSEDEDSEDKYTPSRSLPGMENIPAPPDEEQKLGISPELLKAIQASSLKNLEKTPVQSLMEVSSPSPSVSPMPLSDEELLYKMSKQKEREEEMRRDIEKSKQFRKTKNILMP